MELQVMERAVFHFQNSYNIRNVRAIGRVCKTNIPSNTAFRGFGGPQAMFAAECMVRDIAEYLNKDVIDVCKLNLYKDGDLTHYNQKMENCTLHRCWDQCLMQSDFKNRKKEVEKFNR